MTASAGSAAEWLYDAASSARSVRAGHSATETPTLLHISCATVHLWHRRYRAEGLDGLTDRPRSGRPTVLNRETVERILFLTTDRIPGGASYWSTADGGLRQPDPWQVRKAWQAANLNLIDIPRTAFTRAKL